MKKSDTDLLYGDFLEGGLQNGKRGKMDRGMSIHSKIYFPQNGEEIILLDLALQKYISAIVIGEKLIRNQYIISVA